MFRRNRYGGRALASFSLRRLQKVRGQWCCCAPAYDSVVSANLHLWMQSCFCCCMPTVCFSGAGAKQGGQTLLECMPVHVSRNFFGAQIASFEQQLPAHQCLAEFGGDATYRAVFIRAPAILSVDESRVTVLSKYTLSDSERERSGREDVIVAARCMNMLATAFHPELTDDCRWCDFPTPQHLSQDTSTHTSWIKPELSLQLFCSVLQA